MRRIPWSFLFRGDDVSEAPQPTLSKEPPDNGKWIQRRRRTRRKKIGSLGAPLLAPSVAQHESAACGDDGPFGGPEPKIRLPTAIRTSSGLEDIFLPCPALPGAGERPEVHLLSKPQERTPQAVLICMHSSKTLISKIVLLLRISRDRFFSLPCQFY